jgi:hypothetical protein
VSLRSLAATVLAVAVLAPAASAQTPLLAPEDAIDLAQELADAQAEQGVCYGWEVKGDVESTGSSTGGPDVPLAADATSCPRGFVRFSADVVYECSSCDNGDQVYVDIDASVPDPPTMDDMAELGYGSGDLAGDEDDQALIDMVGALPLLVAESGAAAPVPLERTAVPGADRPTRSPGSDVLRTVAPVAGVAAVVLLLGVGWLLYKVGEARQARKWRARPPTRRERTT